MLILNVFFSSLAILCSVVGASSTYEKKACIKPAVRKEWRVLSSQEKTEWIRAVNVCEAHSPDFRGLNRFTTVPVTLATRPISESQGESFSIAHSAGQCVKLLLRWFVILPFPISE